MVLGGLLFWNPSPEAVSVISARFAARSPPVSCCCSGSHFVNVSPVCGRALSALPKWICSCVLSFCFLRTSLPWSAPGRHSTLWWIGTTCRKFVPERCKRKTSSVITSTAPLKTGKSLTPGDVTAARHLVSLPNELISANWQPEPQFPRAACNVSFHETAVTVRLNLCEAQQGRC